MAGKGRASLGLVSSTRAACMLVVAVLLATLSAAPATAETSLTVRPGKVETTLRPGAVEMRTFEVLNEGISTITVDAAVVDCRVGEDGGVVLSMPTSSTGSSAEWLTLSEGEVVLSPGEVRKVDATIRVPRAASGVFRSAVVFSPRRSPPGSPGFAINGRIAVQVVARVQGEQPLYRRILPDPRLLAGLSAASLFAGAGLLLLDIRRRRITADTEDA